jgi:hypothetical protein
MSQWAECLMSYVLCLMTRNGRKLPFKYFKYMSYHIKKLKRPYPPICHTLPNYWWGPPGFAAFFRERPYIYIKRKLYNRIFVISWSIKCQMPRFFQIKNQSVLFMYNAGSKYYMGLVFRHQNTTWRVGPGSAGSYTMLFMLLVLVASYALRFTWHMTYVIYIPTLPAINIHYFFDT